MKLMRLVAIALACALVAGCDSPWTLPPSDVIAYSDMPAWRAEGHVPGPREAAEHRVSDLQPIVVGKQPGQRWLSILATIDVALTVGPDGRVIEARVVRPPAGYTSSLFSRRAAEKALAQARTLRFEPFLSNGRPTAAKVELWIPLLETRAAPPVSRSFPTGDLGETVIELTRSGCFGTCPTYSVAINGRGEVMWRGDANVAVRGEARDRVDPKIVAALLDRARDAMSRRYSAADGGGASE